MLDHAWIPMQGSLPIIMEEIRNLLLQGQLVVSCLVLKNVHTRIRIKIQKREYQAESDKSEVPTRFTASSVHPVIREQQNTL